jgi:C_GCAxxG_C_C family probable redox protein
MEDDYTQLLQKAYDLAYKYEAERGSCPQAVLSAIMETLHIGDPKTIQAADGLAGGTALSSEGTCGALVGGMLAIGAVVGRSYKDFSEGKRKRRVFQFAKKLYDRFEEEYEGPLCKNVQTKLFGQTYRLIDPKEYEQFEQAGAHVDKCPSVAGIVTKWTIEILEPLIQDQLNTIE